MAEVELFGEFFALKPKAEYEWAMIEFSHAATGGADASLLTGTAAVYDLLESAITDEDWSRFRALAKKKRAQSERDLMPIVVRIFTQAAERPTGRPSDSPDGPSITPESAEVASYRRVIEREEASGRPDRALMVLMAQESTES